MTAIEITPVVSLERRGRIAVIVVDNPPVNAMSHAVREGVVKGVGLIGEDDEAIAGVIACKGRTFFSGADISGSDGRH